MHHSIDSLESRLVLSAPVDLDPTFADGGTFAPPALTGSSRPIDSTMLTDGRTLVLSLIGEPITSDDLTNYATTFAVQRFLANGAIDQTFGSNGTSLVFRRLEATNATIEVAPSGDIFVAAQYGYSFSEESGVRLARLNAEGTIDRSFGKNGVLSIALRGEYFVQPRLAFTGSRIYVAQEQYNPAQKFTVAALRNDGAFDASFGSNGIFEFTSTQQEICSCRIFSRASMAICSWPVERIRLSMVTGLLRYASLLQGHLMLTMASRALRDLTKRPAALLMSS